MLLHYPGKTEQTKYALKWTTNVDKLEIRSYKNLIMVVWANEVHHLLTYYSTSCYQTCCWWHVRVLAGQCTCASVRKTIEHWSAKPQTSSLWICAAPPTALISIWSITSSGDHATAGLSDDVQECGWTRSDWLKSGLVWSRTLLTLLSMYEETVCVLVFAQRADISNIDCSQLNNWTFG